MAEQAQAAHMASRPQHVLNKETRTLRTLFGEVELCHSFGLFVGRPAASPAARTHLGPLILHTPTQPTMLSSPPLAPPSQLLSFTLFPTHHVLATPNMNPRSIFFPRPSPPTHHHTSR